MKSRVHYTLSDESIKTILEFKKENVCRSDSEALDKIINVYKKKEETTSEMMIRIIARAVAKELKAELTGIKKEFGNLKTSIRYTDSNTQIILELLNALFYKQDIGDILTTEELKSEAYVTACNFINSKIKSNSVKKYNNKE